MATDSTPIQLPEPPEPSQEAIDSARTNLRMLYGRCAAENWTLVREVALAAEADATNSEES